MSLPAARMSDSVNCGDTLAQGSGNVFINNLPAARVSDVTTGHGCYPSVPITSGSGQVFINGIPAARMSDSIMKHCDTLCAVGQNLGDDCHQGFISSGSGNVFIG